MVRFKILFLLFLIVLVGIKCSLPKEQNKAEKQLEFAEYITGTTNSTIYDGCVTFRDSSIRKAETIGSHLSFIDSTFAFNADEYGRILDQNTYQLTKKANNDTTLLLIIWFVFIVLLIYAAYNIHNDYKISPQSSKIKRRRVLINVYVSAILFIFTTTLFVYTLDRLNNNKLNTEQLNRITIKQYFLKFEGT